MPDAIASEAQRIGAELWRIGDAFSFAQHEGQWDYRSKRGGRSSLPHPTLRGGFQLNNASAVLAALDVLRERLPVDMQAVRRGLTEVQLAGRFQLVPGRPQWILDVAHNPHAARSLAQNLTALPPCDHTYAVFAMLKDKDIAGVVAVLNSHIDTWLVAGIDAPRGASGIELEHIVEQGRVNGAIKRFDSIAEAVRFACEEVNENDRIAAFGSFYTVAAVMQARSAVQPD
jgi:dihydrofolate synthase/folylpolyglutamate synthase